MSKITCALCYVFIDRVAERLTTGAPCKHSFHADCAVLRLNVNSMRVAGVKLQTKCPACSVTDDRVVTLLESIDQKLVGFGAKLNKVANEVKALRSDFNKLKAEQTATNTKVDAVSERTDDLENRVEAVEANATELKLSAADEAVLLRAACDQVAHQLVVTGLPGVDDEDVKELSKSLIKVLDASVIDVIVGSREVVITWLEKNTLPYVVMLNRFGRKAKRVTCKQCSVKQGIRRNSGVK
ncbi:hypothetical protein KQX54_013009 [Cotesia glomerata]|uniref:RING-type domain-containing protein n=1 Tax=Cotesia glomerata TaxID=32391 RepID=A0AAV7J1L1_COTGL|nr:hypothetical protein KQX54_013009 [Cotesia glomerata]